MSSSGEKKSRRGYRRILSQQFSFNFSEQSKAKATKRPSNSKDANAHPVMRILEATSKKDVAKPEFLRYLEYVREAGTWDLDSEMPKIYFK